MHLLTSNRFLIIAGMSVTLAASACHVAGLDSKHSQSSTKDVGGSHPIAVLKSGRAVSSQAPLVDDISSPTMQLIPKSDGWYIESIPATGDGSFSKLLAAAPADQTYDLTSSYATLTKAGGFVIYAAGTSSTPIWDSSSSSPGLNLAVTMPHEPCGAPIGSECPQGYSCTESDPKKVGVCLPSSAVTPRPYAVLHGNAKAQGIRVYDADGTILFNGDPSNQ